MGDSGPASGDDGDGDGDGVQMAVDSAVRTQEFSEFASEQRGRMLRLAWLLTGERAAAEDLVQTAFESAWRNWSRVGAAEYPPAYLRQILINSFVSQRRRPVSRECPVSAVPEQPARGDAHTLVEHRLVLVTALGRLTARQRAAVVLRYFHDLTEAQTAEALGCSVGTVKSQVHHALRSLRADDALAAMMGDLR